MKTKIILFSQPDEQCPSCKQLKQMLKIVPEFTPDEVVTIFNGDSEADDLAISYGIMSTPAMVKVDENGKELKTVFGKDIPKIAELFQQ